MHGRLAKEAGGPSPAAAVTQPSALPAFVKFVLAGGLAFAVNEAALFLLYDTSLLRTFPVSAFDWRRRDNRGHLGG